MPSIWAKFNHVFEVFQGLFLRFSYSKKMHWGQSWEVKALNNLIKNKDIVIQKTDTGNNIVILNRCYYVSQLSKILVDTSKFSPNLSGLFRSSF